MTTRNFRVKNGIEVGDITISASAGTITGLSTAAPSADGDTANKKYVDDQINAISTTSITTDSNATNATVSGTGASGTLTITANSNTEVTVTDSGMQLGGSGARVNSILDEDAMGSDSATALATQQSIKAYVDSQVTAQDLDFQGDSGGALSIDLDSETLDIAGGTGIDTSGSGNTLTVAIDSTVATLTGSQTLTNKTLTSPVLNTGVSGTAVLDEDNMASNSATQLATQQSIKAYVDTEIGNISTTSVTTDSDATNATVSGTGAAGKFVVTANSNTELTVDDSGVRVHGNLTVDGTSTTINTSTLSVEDNIIEVNRNVSSNSGMPTYSGMRVNRGEGSTATEGDLFWVWDESFADDGTTTFGNSGGAWTAGRGANANDVDALVDIRANVIHARATSAQYADVAERFEADAPMSAGAVVEVGGSAEITETTSDLSENVFGVISDQPAYAMNAAAGNNESHPFVAMTGRTPVRVTGAVTKGQRLVTSSVKGCARAVAQSESITPFHVIGRALEDKADEGIGLVNCAVRTNN